MPQGFGPAPGLGISPHQRAVRQLRQRVEGDQPAAVGDRRIGLAEAGEFGAQPLQNVGGERPAALAGGHQPFLIRLGIDGAVGEKFAAIKLGCRLQIRSAPRPRQLLEAIDIDADTGKPALRAVDDEMRGGARPQRLA
ncbi:MAG TPA: hypothetical protein VGR91_09290 [Stellaceae bacterium]|nr:hypothetical protein [Stellaceae bacterium]